MEKARGEEVSNYPEKRRIEHTAASATVQASIEQCFDVGIDLLAYPEWVDGLRSVAVETTDDEGRPATVRFEAEGLGRRSTYRLAYDLSGAPSELAWSLVEGDLTREIEGRYAFQDITEKDGAALTEVNYELSIDLAVPLPGFVKRRAEDKIVASALKQFKARVESITGCD